MTTIFRFLLYSVEFIIALVVIGACLLALLYVINRGMQFFFGLAGYEIGDFFGYIMNKLGFKRKSKAE